MSGKLYLISTPIGNFADLTIRAKATLKQVDIVAAEHPQETANLLKYHRISSQLTSYNLSNKEEKSSILIHRMQQGETVALVSDEGTPLIHDPGHFLVRKAIKSGLPIIAVPGPSALLTALVVSGFPMDSFVFMGTCPDRSTTCHKLLGPLQKDRRTHILFLTAPQLGPFLGGALRVLGNRRIVLARELTKEAESIERGTIKKLLRSLPVLRQQEKLTLVIHGASLKRGETRSHSKPT